MSRPVSRRGLVQAGAVVLGAVSVPAATVALAKALPASATPDAALVALIERHRTATAEWNRLCERCDVLFLRFLAECPERPAALIARYDDDLGAQSTRTCLPDGRMAMVYNDAQVEQIRANEVPTRREWIGTHEQWVANDKTGWSDVPCPTRIARRAEILAASDAWTVERDAVSDRIGHSVARKEADAACDVVEGTELDILAHKPSTLAGFIAKAQWIVAQNSTEDWSEQIVLDLCSLGETA